MTVAITIASGYLKFIVIALCIIAALYLLGGER